MSDETPHRNAHDITGPGDRYEALAEVLERQVEVARSDRAREAAEERRRRRARPRYGLLAVVTAIAAWLWLFPPGPLRIEPPPPQPVEQEEAALRFAMYVQAQRIEAYRRETGSYPERLEQVGPPMPGMEYTSLVEGLYQLTGVTDRLTLTYRSDLPLDEFVGSGEDVIDVDAL